MTAKRSNKNKKFDKSHSDVSEVKLKGSFYKYQENYTWGLTDRELNSRFKRATELNREQLKISGKSFVGYNTERNLNYIQYPDGTRVYQETTKRW